MKTYFLDFESFYSSEYSLRKMTPAEYILDPRFEVVCLSVMKGVKGTPTMIAPDAIQSWFDSLNPEETILVSHNYLFDGCIIAWKYGFVPRLMVCTLGIARATVGHAMRKGCSLKEVAKYLGLGVKGETVLKVMGMNRAAIQAAGLLPEYEEYCRNDVELCAGIYDKLVCSGTFPMSELVVQDMILRCAVQPNFTYDKVKLHEHKHVIHTEKERLLAQAMLLGAEGKEDLMSNDKFAELLINLGCDPPRKISKTTGLETWAFSKQDEEFLALEEHENPAVQALFGARLGHKSTLEESRTERLINISNLEWPGNLRGNVWAPVPLRYAAAHTHRFGGEWKVNKQNMSRPKILALDPTQQTGKIRRALTVGPDEEVVCADASQIEAREVVTLCEQWSVVEMFAKGVDVYSTFASSVFGFEVNKRDHPEERFCGKQGVLGLGYGLGAPNFEIKVNTNSINETGKELRLGPAQAHKIVTAYRKDFAPNVPKGWRKLNYEGINVLANGGRMEFGPVVLEKGSILGPNGLRIYYDDLTHYDGEWSYTFGGKRKHIYGGKIMENICQFLARIIIMNAAMRIRQRVAKYRLAHQQHDELVYVVKKVDVELMRGILIEEMTRRPSFMPDLPLAVEAKHGPNYGDLVTF